MSDLDGNVTDGGDIRRAAVADRLNSAALRLVRRLRRDDREAGTTSAQLSVISTLVNRGPTTLKNLAALEKVRPPTVTRLVQALERDGLIIRRTARDDGRVSVVSATSKGWKTLEDVHERRLALLRGRLADLGEDELRTLEAAARLMERLSDEE